MGKFKELFESYGYKVESFGKSYIADNGVFCIPYTEFNRGSSKEIAGVSFLSDDKESIKAKYKDFADEIGFRLFYDWMSNRCDFVHIGNVCNHDHTLYEVESWLKRGK